MDVWVNFKNATKWQAEGIFKCFFPFKPVANAAASSSSSPASAPSTPQDSLAVPSGERGRQVIPTLSEEEIFVLAKRFGDSIPEDEFSVSRFCHIPERKYLAVRLLILLDKQVASLQGFLLKNKTRPRECVDEVGDW